MNVLFFSPYAYFWQHAFPESLFAQALTERGHAVTTLTCGGTFGAHCLCMKDLSLDASNAEKQRFCNQCVYHAELLRLSTDFEILQLSTLLGPREYKSAQIISETLTQEQILDFAVHDVPLGRAALFETLLQYKVISLPLAEEPWRKYKFSLQNTLLTVMALRRLLQERHFDRLVVYNGHYSTNHAAIRLAESRGIPAYFIHGGPNFSRLYQSLMIGRGNYPNYERAMRVQWPRFRHRSLTAHEAGLVTDHLLTLFASRLPFVYSQASTGNLDLRGHYGVVQGQKILLATLSSYDELFSAYTIGTRSRETIYSELFPTQIGWIQALKGFCAANPQYFLIVRVHPREFPNRRDPQLSEHARMLREQFEELPVNMVINWPDEQLSLYDMAEEVDVFLNAFSTTGLEMALLGQPVVAYDAKLLAYPSEINICGETLQDYFDNIHRAAITGWSLETMRLAYRWLGLCHGLATADLTGVHSLASYPEMRSRRVIIKGRETVISQQEYDCICRPPLAQALDGLCRVVEKGVEVVPQVLESSQTVATKGGTHEDHVLREQIGRILLAKYGTLDHPGVSGTLRAKLCDAYHELEASSAY